MGPLGTAEDRAFWAIAADVSRDMFAKVTGSETGLSPDRNYFDETQILRNGVATALGYDSWRSVSNWSVAYSWWRKDAREIALSDRMQKFLAGQGISKFADRYTLDGKPLSTRHSTGMLATTAVASLAASAGSTSKAFVEELWNTPVPSGRTALLRRHVVPHEHHAREREFSPDWALGPHQTPSK